MSIHDDATRTIADILSHARSLGEDEQTEFVDRRCGRDVALRTAILVGLADADASGRGPGGARTARPFPGAVEKRVASVGGYAIESILGEGGFGVVYRAIPAAGGPPVALKTVRAASEAVLSSLRREVAGLSRLRHPGIVGVVDHGVEEGRPWYAMELIAGTTLRDAAAAAPSLAGKLALVRDLCHPVAFLHGEGLVHRDLKPANVIVRDDGVPVIVDFGLASRIWDERGRALLEWTADVAGSIAYMAPEQAKGEPVDARADVYALGCVLYEVLTGRPPIVGESAAHAIYLKATLDPEPPSRHARGLPLEIDALALATLTRDPRGRTGYAAEVAAELERAHPLGREAPEGPRPRPYVYRAELSGRTPILAALRTRLDDVEDGCGHVLLLRGESGVGKTRLLAEIAVEAERRGWLVLAGECAPISPAGTGSGAPLELLRRPLQRLADLCTAGTRQQRDRWLGDRGPVLAPCEPSLATVPGQEERPPPIEIDPAASRLRLIRALSATLAAVAEDRPLLLLLDDLHYSDDLAIALLRHLVDGVATAPRSLVVGSLRAEKLRDDLRELASRTDVLDVGRLDERGIADMAAGMLAMDPPPGALVALLHRESEGNPFFASELVRGAVAGGMLRRQRGRWCLCGEIGGTADADIAQRLQALLAHRLEGLSEEARAVAEWAAVTGRTVELDDLAAMVPGPIDVAAAIAQLCRNGVLEEHVPAESCVRFQHDRLRTLVYGAQDAERLRHRHEAWARLIDGMPPGRRTPRLATLAYHYGRAGRPSDAVRSHLEAGRHAFETSAWGAAEDHNEAVLAEPAATASQQLAARVALLRLHELRGVHERAESSAREVVAAARLAGDIATEAFGMRAVGNALTAMGRIADAEVYLRQALDRARASDTVAAAQAREHLARVLIARGSMEEAGHLLDEALAALRDLDEPAVEGSIHRTRGVLCRRLGRMEEARHHYERAVALHGDAPGQLLRSLGMLATVLYMRGELSEAACRFEEALRIARATGHVKQEASLLGNLAGVHRDTGEIDRARACYERSLALNRECGDVVHAAVDLTNLGSLELEVQRPEAARRRLEEALPVHEAAGHATFVAHTLGDLAAVDLEEGHLSAARSRLEQAHAIHTRLGDAGAAAEISRVRAEVERRDGKIAEAREALTGAITVLERLGRPGPLARALIEMAHLDMAQAGWLPGTLTRIEELSRQAGARPGSALSRAVEQLRDTAAARGGLP